MSGTKITRNLPNNAYQAAISADSPSDINPYATINDIPAATGPNGNQLISGGASYSGTGLVFDVSFLEYRIAGIEYTADPTQVTLAAADPTFGRFDAIVADEDGVVSVLTGTPASEPLTPSIGDDVVLVQYVALGPGATSPTVTSVIIYNDGSAPNWTPGVSGTGATFPTADFTSTTPNPFIGSECTLMTFNRYSTGRYIKYTAPAPVNRADYAVLTFRIWLFDDLSTIDNGLGRQPFVRLMGSGANELLGSIYLTSWGLQRNLTNTWQLISIPMNVFVTNPSVDDIAMFRIHCVEYLDNALSIPDTQIAIDDVRLQTGYGPQTSLFSVDVLNEGTIVGSTGRLDFKSASGLANRISENTTDNSITISPNTPKIVSTLAVAGTWVIDAADTTIAQISGQAVSPLNIPNPINATRDGQQLILKIKDNGFAVTLSWGPAWTAFTGVTLPSSTATGKWQYIIARYDQGSGNWHVIDVKEEV